MKRPPLYTLFELTGFRWWFRRLYRVQIRGAERIPQTGPAILVANHESLLDPWILGLATPRPIRYMAKAELWKYPALGTTRKALGTFPVSRGDRAAVGVAAELLEQAQLLGMFPQGTCLPIRARPWHRGAAKLAIASGAPVVPVAIINSEKALRPAKPKLGLPKIYVLVGEPIAVEAGRVTVAAAKQVTARIEAAIEKMRQPYGPPAHAWYDDAIAGGDSPVVGEVGIALEP
jgi:1-acyl-sn-glycerol-3-phosphate acyltransferase